MDTFADKRDHKLLESDRYTFFVLGRIMDGPCRLLLTDHERLILCYSDHPYPVWIWTSDDASFEEMEKAWQLSEDNGLLETGYSFNMKYGLAEYFIKRAAQEGKQMHVSMNMFAYDCPEPIPPVEAADGEIHRCTWEDLEELMRFMDRFAREVEIDQKDMESYREDARLSIACRNTYFWKDGEGRNVACCRYNPSGELASIGLVYTRPEYRRMHYAENLVYRVTMLAKERGHLPMLYTNADYEASNACYEKIGYVLRGKLCTISMS